MRDKMMEPAEYYFRQPDHVTGQAVSVEQENEVERDEEIWYTNRKRVVCDIGKTSFGARLLTRKAALFFIPVAPSMVQ